MRFVLACVAAAIALSSGTGVVLAQPAPDMLDFSLPSTLQPGQDLTFTVRGTNRGQSATSGSISISFPGQEPVSVVDSTPALSKGSYAQVFQRSSQIFNFSSNQRMSAQYPLAELFLQETWSPGQERYLTVRVSTPTNGTSLRIQARVTLRSAAGLVNFPLNGPVDQQGFPVHVRQVPIAIPPAPPTSTLVPTRTAIPTATAIRTSTPQPTQAPIARATIAVAGAQATSGSPQPATAPQSLDSTSSGGGTAVWLLVGLLGSVTAIAVAAVAFTRRPAPRPAQQPTAPYTYRPSPPPAPVSPPPQPHSYPPPGAPGASTSTAVPSGYQIVGAPKYGGMATVYKAYQPSLHRYVALKVLSPSLGSDPSFLERFQGEARWTARLEHPNIVPIYDRGQANGSVFIVMRFIDGVSLQELLQREVRLPFGRAVNITAQVAAALDYAHAQGFVHRDVKPANVMVEQGDRVTLTDFGIAKAVGETRLTRTGSIVGTPEYLSPEQARGDAVDGRADLYALGIVVYEMLAGRPPFQAENPLSVVHAHLMTPPPPPSQFNAAIPSAVTRVLLKVLAKEPGQRYPTGDAFVQALRQAGAGRV